MKKLNYIFDPPDTFIDSPQAKLTISIAMLTSLLSRKLLTRQQFNDCVAKLKKIYNA